MNKKAFGKRVMAARKALGMSQPDLAKAVGMKQQGIDSIEKGGVERPRKMRELARELKKSEEFLLYGEEPTDRRVVPIGQEFDPDPPHDKIVTTDDKPFPDALPQMLGRMGAGSTGAVITIDVGEMQSREEVGEWWRIPPAVLRGLARSDVSRTIGFSMDGADSMEPTILRTDIVFIDTGRQDIEPDGIWALDYGLGRTLKRVSIRKRDGDTYYLIKSDNKAYPDEEYHEDEVTVFGRFIGRFSVF